MGPYFKGAPAARCASSEGDLDSRSRLGPVKMPAGSF